MVKTKQSSLFNLPSSLKKNWFVIGSISIILLSAIFRFYNFSDRWGLGNDDSRDVAIAMEALRRHELPLIGSFSSAGPFVFGPIFYWFIMGSYIILPFAFTAPWIMTAVTGIALVGILMFTAYQLEGKRFSLLIGVLTALSPQLVWRSLSLGQHTFVALFSSLLLLTLILLYKKPRLYLALFFGISLGIAINFHYQALNLLVFLPVLFFLPKLSLWKKISFISVAGAGIIIGLLPLLLWDSGQQFANFRNVLDYLLIGQHRLYVPNSWRLFLFTYLPQYWSIVAGGFERISLFLMALTGVAIAAAIIRHKLKTVWLYLLIPFGILLLINRFYKGERSEGYLLYLLPLVLLITGYGIYILWRRFQTPYSLTKLFAGVSLLILLLGNVVYIQSAFTKKTNVKEWEDLVKVIAQKHPGKKFTVYDYRYQFPHISQPVSILLKKHGLADRSGIPIGFTYISERNPSHPIITSVSTLAIVDLSNEASLSAQSKVWAPLSPEDMYDDLVGRWQKNKLTSSFSLQKYLLERLHLIPSE